MGSCIGDAATGCLGTGQVRDDATRKVLSASDAGRDESEASRCLRRPRRWIRSRASYSPDDTGSDGLSVAKACANAELISGYTHAFSFDALLTACRRSR